MGFVATELAGTVLYEIKPCDWHQDTTVIAILKLDINFKRKTFARHTITEIDIVITDIVLTRIQYSQAVSFGQINYE